MYTIDHFKELLNPNVITAITVKILSSYTLQDVYSQYNKINRLVCFN